MALPARMARTGNRVRFRPRQPGVVSHGRKSWDQYFISGTKAPATTTPTKQPPATAPAREATPRPPQHPPRRRATRTCGGSGGVQERGKAQCGKENVRVTTFTVVAAKAGTSTLAANGFRRRRPAGAPLLPFVKGLPERFQPTPRLPRLDLPANLVSNPLPDQIYCDWDSHTHYFLGGNPCQRNDTVFTENAITLKYTMTRLPSGPVISGRTIHPADGLSSDANDASSTAPPRLLSRIHYYA